jgi:hypothetical protein
MKRAYSKPSLYVEPIKLDMPIAGNCIAERADIEALMTFGYFNEEHSCGLKIEEVEKVKWGDNTYCYHSNIQMVFLS